MLGNLLLLQMTRGSKITENSLYSDDQESAGICFCQTITRSHKKLEQCFKILKENNFQFKILCPFKLFLKYESRYKDIFKHARCQKIFSPP